MSRAGSWRQRGSAEAGVAAAGRAGGGSLAVLIAALTALASTGGIATAQTLQDVPAELKPLYGTASKDSGYIPTPATLVERMLRMAGVSSADFVTAMEREANPKDGAEYAFYYNVIKGWDAYSKGKAKSISGITTPDASTIVFNLTAPTGDFLKRHAFEIVLILLIVYSLKFGIPGMGASATMITPDKLKGSMDDLIGMEDIKQEVLHLEDMIRNREEYQSHNIDKPFNVMLTGPAGTGKTKLVGYLAKRLDMPLISASGSALESGYVGGGSKALNALYRKACAKGKCIIFLDEAQSLFMPRGRSEKL